ncbi:MAG: DHA2 family efflux MFS transporter permease subunit [Candidatus Kryptoniota bacterium]
MSFHNGNSNSLSSGKPTAFGNPQHGSYKWWVLANIMLGTFMAVLDSTIVNVSLPKIMAAFGITVDKAEWVINGYLLAFAVMLPSSGWLADHFGYKRMYMLALFLFTSGSFLCGLAWNENALIFFRVIQGLGGGIITPVGMAIVLREFPLERRGTALGFWAIAAASSVSFGPLIGGYLVDNFSWHAIFDVNIPVGILALFATWAIQREYKVEHARSFDIVGFISMSTFLVSLLLALADGNAAWNTGGWTSTFILSCFAIAFVSLVIFLITEFRVKHPILELNLLKSFNYSMANIVLFIFGFSVFGSTFLLPLYLQDSLGYTAYQAGAVYLPMGIIQGIVAPISGILADRINPKIIAITGIVLLAWSWYLNGFLSLFSMHAEVMFPVYLRGFGMGLLFTPLSTVALSDIRKEKMAQASGLFNVIRQVGGSFGVAVIGTLLTERTLFHTAINGQAMSQYSPAFQHVSYTLRNFATQVLSGPLNVEIQRAKALVMSNVAQQAIVQATDDTFLFAFAIMILCVIPIFFLRTHKKKAAGRKAVTVH